MMNVVVQTDTVQVATDEPTANITVASGVNGRRGSYFFVGSLTNPNNAVSDEEITQDPDIQVLSYDVYYSNTTAQQWQYRVDVDGNLKWMAFQPALIETITSYKGTIDTTTISNGQKDIIHNLNTYNVLVNVFSATVPYIDVAAYVERLNANTVRVKFAQGIATGTYTVMILAVPSMV